MEPFLGPAQQGAGPSLFANPAFPLPRHGTEPKDEATIPAGFPYTPTNWCSASPTALAYCDDGCGASMAHSHAKQQPASNILGDVPTNVLHHKHALRTCTEIVLCQGCSVTICNCFLTLLVYGFLLYTTMHLCLVHVILPSARCCFTRMAKSIMRCYRPVDHYHFDLYQMLSQ